MHTRSLAGGVIMYGALILFEDEFIHIVSISFSALILTELIMVALTIRTWHKWVSSPCCVFDQSTNFSQTFRLMVMAELFSLVLYILSLVILHDYFGTFHPRYLYHSDLIIKIQINKFSITDWDFIWSYEFLWKVLAITLVSCLPLYIIKFLRRKFSAPSYAKLS